MRCSRTEEEQKCEGSYVIRKALLQISAQKAHGYAENRKCFAEGVGGEISSPPLMQAEAVIRVGGKGVGGTQYQRASHDENHSNNGDPECGEKVADSRIYTARAGTGEFSDKAIEWNAGEHEPLHCTQGGKGPIHLTRYFRAVRTKLLREICCSIPLGNTSYLRVP